MTKAKDIIIAKAEELIDLLVRKEESRLDEIRKEYQEFLVDYPIDESENGVYTVNQNSHYTRSIQFALKSVGFEKYAEVSSNELHRVMYSYSSSIKVRHELELTRTDKVKQSYLDDYRVSNRVKLVRAVEKYITDDMEVQGDVVLDPGVKGVEVRANVKKDDEVKLFKTRAIFAGGYIQRYHYRYRGDLVNV